jgi:hypothetical protein
LELNRIFEIKENEISSSKILSQNDDSKIVFELNIAEFITVTKTILKSRL